ncbi:MAG TPA: homoaconitate hydratase [Candidatus Thermoplasmatota archaeon]|nr:homoaconitate hydratase [Candidatus Thermoplasmatota archaeon]
MTRDDLLVHNYVVEANLPRRMPPRVVFWDETLRDGEQTPGVYFTPDEKVQLAKVFDDLGITILNCGIPAVSDKELQSVKRIAAEGLRNASVLAACRTLRSDIDACLKSDADECSPFIAASPVHLKHKLRMTEEQAIAAATDAVQYAKDHGLKTTFVTEDTVRADLDFVGRIYNAAIEAGADRILYCDTVGVMTPATMRWWVNEARSRIRLDGTEEGVHIHNDFGMATANTLAAVEEGVPVVNTTFGGLGERAGNAPFEEIVMALELLYDVRTGIKIERIHEAARRVEELSGVPLGITKPIVGYNAFTHESGIHTDGVIKHTLTYEPIQVDTLRRQRRFVFGKHTGARAVEARLQEHGLGATPEQVRAIVAAIKEKTETTTKREVAEFVAQYRAFDENHKGVTPREFWAIAAKAGVSVPADLLAGARKERSTGQL